MTPTRLIAFLVGMTSAGCVSNNPSDRTAVLRVPHEFILVLEKRSGRPGDFVKAHMEFTNLGPEVLWVPERGQLAFCFAGPSDSIEDLPPSACSGITYKRVRPGKQLSYDTGFKVPSMSPGKITIYLSEEKGVKVPF